MRHPRFLALIASFLLAAFASGCLPTAEPPPAGIPTPTAEAVAPDTVAAPSPSQPILAPPTPTRTPALAATPPPAATASPEPSPAATSPPRPPASPPGATPRPTIETFALPVPPGKVGSGLQYLMITREKGWATPGSDVARVLEWMDQMGGADVGIWFDHILSEDEAADLEVTFGMKFPRFDGQVHKLTPIYAAIVPWEQIIPVARLPYVKIIDTSAWPPSAR